MQNASMNVCLKKGATATAIRKPFKYIYSVIVGETGWDQPGETMSCEVNTDMQYNDLRALCQGLFV